MSSDAAYWSRHSRVSYYWLQQELEADATFALEAVKVLKHANPISTYTTASSSSGLLNHWVVERELTVYERGKPVHDVADFVLYPNEQGDYSPAMRAVEQGWRVDRAQFAALLTQYGMTMPNILKIDAPSAINDWRLTVLIEGREALPVRAIPYVTGWKLSPDEVARHLAREDGPPFAQLKNISAYHQHATSPVKVLPKEWDAVVTQLAAFEKKLRAKFGDYDRGYAAWRDKAVSVLPAGVFVWLKEFKREFRKDLSPERITYTNERPGDRDLILTPMLPDGVREIVFEGFEVDAEHAPANSAEPPTPIWTAEKKALLRNEHAKLCAKGHKSPTKALAEKYNVSTSRIRDLKSNPVSKQHPWKGLGGK